MNNNNTANRLNTFDSYQFDFGIGSSSKQSKPIKQQQQTQYNHQPQRNTTTNAGAAKPWTHQPAAGFAPAASRSGNLVSGPSAMVGDIFGKSWGSTSTSTAAGIGIPKSDPNLFSDLVGSALGQGKGAANVPLKSAAPRNAFSMGNLSESMPKQAPVATPATNSTTTRSGTWGSADNLENFADFNAGGSKIGNSIGGGGIGGQPMKFAGKGTPMSANKDPFGSLMGFGSKTAATKAPTPNANVNANANANANGNANLDDISFGAFQGGNSSIKDEFGSFSSAAVPPQPAPVNAGPDPLDMFASAAGSSTAGVGVGQGNQEPFGEMNDWEFGAEFGGQDVDGGGPTTELEGLPPPPAGVNAASAKTKGMDNYKQGQFADAIKWLSWAVVLLEKSSDGTLANEVLSCRASCYKEVGEYKKAVADCSKVLEHDSANVSILVQRALLYESMEKYKLGADDLRTVLKIDPGNRLAKSTIHRLNKFAD